MLGIDVKLKMLLKMNFHVMNVAPTKHRCTLREMNSVFYNCSNTLFIIETHFSHFILVVSVLDFRVEGLEFKPWLEHENSPP